MVYIWLVSSRGGKIKNMGSADKKQNSTSWFQKKNEKMSSGNIRMAAIKNSS